MAKIKIDVYSHGFCVQAKTPAQAELVAKFSFRYVRWGFKWDFRSKRNVRVQMGVYAAATRDRSEVRYHRNCLAEFLEHLRNNGIREEGMDLTYHDPSKINWPQLDVNLADGWSLRPVQEKVKDFCFKQLSDKRTTLIGLPPGMGKGLPLDTPVRIRNGWKNIGELDVGDEVMSQDGTMTKITDVFDNKDMECYKITFADGRDVICDIEHRWDIYSSKLFGDKNLNTTKTISTSELLDLYKKVVEGSNYQSRMYQNTGYLDLKIPLINSFSSDDADISLPIDPYLLGVLLGDGFITVHGAATISKPDEFIYRDISEIAAKSGWYVVKSAYDKRCLTYYIKSNPDSPNYKEHLSDILIRHGLNGKRSWEKFIPEEYLNGSFEQRLSLLQGLLDTDGYIEEGRNFVDYSTTSKILAEQVQYLARSIGAIATLKSRQTKYSYKGSVLLGRVSYRVSIRSNNPKGLVRTPTKKNIISDKGQYVNNGLKLRISKIERVENQSTRCIKVDHPSELFVIKDHIVTHNTITMLGIAAEMKMRFVVILRPQYIERWIGAFKETWNLKDEEILTISGSGNLKGLFDLGLSNQLGNIKAIIISNKTFQNYLKDYEVYGKEFHVMGWNVEPQRYAEVLGARFVYVDEGHQDSHLNFKIALYTHCENMVTATGTLTPDDPFLKKMTFIQFPIETRFMISAEDNHIAANAIFYKFNNPNAIKHNTPQGYNHGEFEKSLMKSKLVLSNYFKLISDLINEGYVSTRKEGYKCLIFVYSIAMATELTKYLNITYPDLVVNRYCEDDDYENLMNADVCVSTVLSAGTAVDIPGLSCAILTQSLSSTQSNLQAIGRLRPMKDGHTPQFYWLVCEDFEKHIEYHEKKRKMFKDIVKSYQYFNTGRKL